MRDQLTDRAADIGRDNGSAAAQWIFDGNTSYETYCRVLTGIEDGDPEILDSYRTSDLSGDYTERDLITDLGLDAVDAPIGDINAACDAYAVAKIAQAAAEDFAPPSPPDPGKLAQRAAETAERASAAQAASHVFGNGNQAVYPNRDPQEQEKTAARKLARALRAATAGERATTTTTSLIPPGRLSMRQALAGRAQREAGGIPTAEPFTRSLRKRVPAPPLRVGIACDVSGSMRRFTGPVASAAWILARATASLPTASTATVTYGEAVRPVTHPGHIPARVTEFPATGGGHQIGQAIEALDGALGLSRPGAARLLVIVSDGIYTRDDISAAQSRIARLTASGCGVIWLGPETAAAWPAECAQAITLANPAATVDTIARAATRALTN